MTAIDKYMLYCLAEQFRTRAEELNQRATAAPDARIFARTTGKADAYLDAATCLDGLIDWWRPRLNTRGTAAGANVVQITGQ